jgi:hypothetical protein
MKTSRKNVRSKATATPELRFEDQRLTFSASVLGSFCLLIGHYESNA